MKGEEDPAIMATSSAAAGITTRLTAMSSGRIRTNSAKRTHAAPRGADLTVTAPAGQLAAIATILKPATKPDSCKDSIQPIVV